MSKYTEVFKRYEKKYMLTIDQYEALMEVLLTKMKVDKHGKHTICNVYLDTDDYQLICTSIEKPVYKEKIRIRSYGVPEKDDTVFVELKKKYDGIVYKRRVSMTLEEAERYLTYGEVPNVKSTQIMDEIDYVMNFYHPASKVYIAYDRVAMFGIEDSALRITFDSDIRWRDDQLSLNDGAWGIPILNQNNVLMEVKTSQAMPLWLIDTFNKLGILPCSFSKYGTCYKQNIAPTLVSKLKGEVQYVEENHESRNEWGYNRQPSFNTIRSSRV